MTALRRARSRPAPTRRRAARAMPGPLRSSPHTVQRSSRPLPPQAKAGQAYDATAQGAQQAKDVTQV